MKVKTRGGRYFTRNIFHFGTLVCSLDVEQVEVWTLPSSLPVGILLTATSTSKGLGKSK